MAIENFITKLASNNSNKYACLYEKDGLSDEYKQIEWGELRQIFAINFLPSYALFEVLCPPVSH